MVPYRSNSVLPNHMSDLANFIGLESRCIMVTFIFDGNETQVDGLVNFEKLRMLSQQIRNIRKYCETPIMARNTVLCVLSEHLHYVSTECND